MKIYQIAPALRLIFDEAFVDDDGVFHFDQATFDEVAGNAREKIANTGRYIREAEAEIEAMKQAENDIAHRREVKEKALERLQAMTIQAVQALGEKIEMPDIRVNVNKCPTKVDITEGVKLADRFLTVTTKTTPNKKALKDALEKGEEIEGVRLVTNYRLSIK